MYTPKLNDEIIRNEGNKSRDGIRGTVVELNEHQQRARILWHSGPFGMPIKMPRTWMRWTALIPNIEWETYNVVYNDGWKVVRHSKHLLPLAAEDAARDARVVPIEWVDSEPLRGPRIVKVYHQAHEILSLNYPVDFNL